MPSGATTSYSIDVLMNGVVPTGSSQKANKVIWRRVPINLVASNVYRRQNCLPIYSYIYQNINL